MTIRPFACAVLLGLACSHAVAAKKKDPPTPPPQEIDVDAMARAKDADAQAKPAADADTAAPVAAEPAPADAGATAAEPKSESAPRKDEPAAEASSQEAVALTPPIDPAEKRVALACESRSKNLLDAAQKGDFAAATKDFDAKMRTAMPPAKFKQTWASLSQFGTLQARGQSHPAKGEGYFIVMTPLIFEKTTLITQVACGSDGRVAGFYVKPLSAVQQ